MSIESPAVSSHYSVLALSNARSDLVSKALVNVRDGSPDSLQCSFCPSLCNDASAPQSQWDEDVPLLPDAITQSPPGSPGCLHTMELA